MADEPKIDNQATTAEFLEGLYGDPFRPETSRTGRHLVIASAISIAASIFNVQLHGTSLIPINFGERTDVLPMLLALTVILLALSFILRAASDLFRDREIGLLVLHYIERIRVETARKSARETDAEVYEKQYEDDGSAPDPWWEPYFEIKEKSNAAVAKAEERIGLRRMPRAFRQVRRALEMIIPIAFAVIAIAISWHHLIAFGCALWRAL
ncbi:MAG: hypothetical protein ACTHM2_05160 [Afipia sp.]